MKQFTMCPQCQAEYDNPRNRRFHAQPNACPDCGPQLELWSAATVRRVQSADCPRSPRYDALVAAAEAIRAGKIVAVKGIGGFHLMVDARNEAAVKRLRERKHREEKPFALMFPIARERESRLRSFAAGRTPAAFARSADCFAAPPQESSNRKSANCKLPKASRPAIPISA